MPDENPYAKNYPAPPPLPRVPVTSTEEVVIKPAREIKPFQMDGVQKFGMDFSPQVQKVQPEDRVVVVEVQPSPKDADVASEGLRPNPETEPMIPLEEENVVSTPSSGTTSSTATPVAVKSVPLPPSSKLLT